MYIFIRRCLAWTTIQGLHMYRLLTFLVSRRIFRILSWISVPHVKQHYFKVITIHSDEIGCRCLTWVFNFPLISSSILKLGCQTIRFILKMAWECVAWKNYDVQTDDKCINSKEQQWLLLQVMDSTILSQDQCHWWLEDKWKGVVEDNWQFSDLPSVHVQCLLYIDPIWRKIHHQILPR